MRSVSLATIQGHERQKPRKRNRIKSKRTMKEKRETSRIVREKSDRQSQLARNRHERNFPVYEWGSRVTLAYQVAKNKPKGNSALDTVVGPDNMIEVLDERSGLLGLNRQHRSLSLSHLR
jgi:hypothetical protein